MTALALLGSMPIDARERWTVAQANAWYDKQPWLVGVNYIPANAINSIEMWQVDTFDPATIDKELGWAENIGMNVIRVYLNNLLFEQDAQAFKTRIDCFFKVAARHNIKVMFVLFDSFGNPEPHLGPQEPPVPGVHNSGWVQTLGALRLADTAHYRKLEAYARGVVGAFARDSRVIAWDMWNEPTESA